LASEGVSPVSPVNTPRSYAWYILPVVFGLLGGVIAYFVLRKTDSKKAKICLILGIGISAIWWIGVFASSGTSETNSKVTTTEKNEEQRAAEVRIEELEKQKATLERENKLQQEKLEQRELQKQESRWDEQTVQNFLGELPNLGLIPKEILNQCRQVSSVSDYIIFATAVGIANDEMIAAIYGAQEVYDSLEDIGYADEPRIARQIAKNNQLLSDARTCIDDLLARYG